MRFILSLSVTICYRSKLIVVQFPFQCNETNRYNISFLQSLSIEDSNSSGTVSLSDTRPPSSSSAVPQTLSELLEDECALLE